MARYLVISLLRHGLTVENERKAYIGWTDSPLSLNGKRELEGKNYERLTPHLLFSSPLQRCVHTAKILFPDERLHIIDELKEMNFGKWEGKTYDELKHRPAYRNWLNDIFTQPIEAGETFVQFSERITSGLQRVEKIAKKKEMNRITIITHGGVIRHILHTLYAKEKSFFDWEIPYGGGYELTWPENELKEGDERCTLLAVVPTTVKQIG